MKIRSKALASGSALTLVGGSASALILALASPASASATYTVDDLSDGAANGSDCTTPVPGSCSLRDALDATSSGDTIVFQSGLTGTITLNGSELEINDSIALLGPGASSLTIDANNASRVFYLCSGSSATTIAGVTITGGNESDGGALYDECSDGFTLRNVVVTGNSASQDGGAVFSGGPTFIYDSVISNNDAGGSGGGMYIDGDLLMNNTRVTGNSGPNGGGIFASGDIQISNSTVSDNTAYYSGGGLYSSTEDGTVSILSSTFNGNTASNAYGGAIDIDGQNNVVMIANTTITNNTSGTAGGGLHVSSSNSVVVAQSTIVGNSSTSDDPLYSGGGIHVGYGSGGTTGVVLSGSIVSGNTSVAGAADISLGSMISESGSFYSYNSLLGDVDSRFAVVGTNNVYDTNPMVGALANNGGLTQTMALLSGSPAIDAGPDPVAVFVGNSYDQRGPGFARIVGTRSDIGAFEIQGDPAPEPTPDPVVPVFTG